AKVVNAEREAALANERVHQLEAASGAAKAAAAPLKPNPGWQLDRLGFDCPGGGIGKTEGSNPEAGKWTKPKITAVCWYGNNFKSPSEVDGRAWCTYKAIAPEACVSGLSPGRLYRCTPPQG